MKRLAIVLMIVIVCIGFSENLIAEQKATEVFTNFGGFILHSGAGLFFIGANIDHNLGRYLVLTGNANVLWYLYLPIAFEYAGVLNFKVKNAFFGCGISRLQSFWGGGEGVTLLKMNIGIKTKKIRASLFIYSHFENTFESENTIMGVQIGIRIK